jgi:hypothetical protein
MKKFIFSCLAALSLLSLSCKKIDPGGINLSGTVNPNTITIRFYQAALDYIQLPANRYFIYKDSATGSTDSVRVTQSVIETSFQAATSGFPGSPATYSDVFKLTLTKFQAQTPTNQTWLQGIARCATYGGIISATIIDSNIAFYNEQSNLYLFWHPFSSFGLGEYKYTPTMTIEGITYTGVQSFYYYNMLPSTDINYQASVIYWVKGIGIIKREIRTYNSVKTSLLVRYG